MHVHALAEINDEWFLLSLTSGFKNEAIYMSRIPPPPI
jgi:hypothetical protein